MKIDIARSVFAAALLAAAFVRPASAQEAPPPPPADATRERWDATVDLLFSGSTGNTELLLFSTGADLTHLETDRYEMEFTSRVRYGTSEDEEVAREAEATAKFDWRPDNRVSPFVFALARHDRVRRLDFRGEGGAGAKYVNWRRGDDELSTSLALLASYEQLRLDDAAADTLDATRWTARWSGRVKGERSLSDDVTVKQTTFWQPAVDDFGDYLVDAATELRIAMTDRLSFKVLHSYERDSTPAEGVEPDDQTLEVGLTVDL